MPGAPSKLTLAWARVGSRVSSARRSTPSASPRGGRPVQDEVGPAVQPAVGFCFDRQAVGAPAAVGVGAGERGEFAARGDLGQHVGAGVRAAGQDLAGEHRGGEEWHREEGAAEFLGDDGQFGQAAAGSAQILGDAQAGQALGEAQAGQAHLGAEQPPGLLVVAGAGSRVFGLGVESAAGGRDAAHAFDEVADRLAQRVQFARALGVLLRADGRASHVRPLTRRSSRASSSARVRPSIKISSWCSCIQTVW